MTRKELLEIRKHLKAANSNITTIYGCYVNQGERSIISSFELPTSLMSETEFDMYLDVFKRVLSGSTQKNRVTVEMTEDVAKAHGFVDLWEEHLKNDEHRDILFRTIIDAVYMTEGENYLILLAENAQDVLAPSEETGELESEESYHYFICALCPVKTAASELTYTRDNMEFHTCSAGQIAQNPIAGFIYPSFENRSTNLDKAHYYMKKPVTLHDDLISALFGQERPMTDEDRQKVFQNALKNASGSGCDFIVAQNLFQSLRDKSSEISASSMPELETMKVDDVQTLLVESGFDDQQAEDFIEEYRTSVGNNSRLMPSAIMDNDKFIMESETVKIVVDPDVAGRIRMQKVDGRNYVLIPVDEGFALNGIDVC